MSPTGAQVEHNKASENCFIAAIASVDAVSVAVDARVREDAQRSVIAYCGADGKAVIAQANTLKALARTDTKGIVRILSIGTRAR